MIGYELKEVRNKNTGKIRYFIDNVRVSKAKFVLVATLADNIDCFTGWHESKKGLQYYCKFAKFNSVETLKGIL
jgi:hypothetical protein